MPGERISLIEKPSSMEPDAMDGWYYCDGVLLGVTKPYGRGGQRLDYWRLAPGLIPPGLTYVGSLPPSGCARRNYGSVSTERIPSKAQRMRTRLSLLRSPTTPSPSETEVAR